MDKPVGEADPAPPPGPTSMRARVLRLLLRPTAPPLALGLVVAPLLLAAETGLVYLLMQVTGGSIFGVVFLLGILVVSTVWGLRLGALTTLASAAVYVLFHRLQTGGSILGAVVSDAVAVGVFLLVALSATTLAGLARLRAREADRRRREVEVSHDELGVLAEHQAALRRVATLVARGANPSEVFAAVSDELARCLHAVNAGLLRYEPDGSGCVVDVQYEPGITNMPVAGERIPLAGDDVGAVVLRTGRAARIDSHDNVSGPEAERIRAAGIGSIVGAPIVIDGHLWGAAIIGTTKREPLAPDAEARLCDFTDLVATAMANADAHAELTASRVRIVAAADHARRRIERDLHDGAQQRLVSLGLELRTVEAGVPSDLVPLKARISDLVNTVTGISEDLQELSRGIHPAILSKGGLGPAIKVLARRSAIPVELVLGIHRRLPDSVEVAAYYVVAEALTNAAKHAQASMVEVCADTEGQDLHLSIGDDGIGGADAATGSGISGLRDRVEALGGTLSISSHPGTGTELRATIPFEAPPHPNGPTE
jgi:signal transduction histidine kinase